MMRGGQPRQQGELDACSLCAPLDSWITCYALLDDHCLLVWVRSSLLPFNQVTMEPTLCLNMQQYGVAVTHPEGLEFVVANSLHSLCFRAPTTKKCKKWVDALSHCESTDQQQPQPPPPQRQPTHRTGVRSITQIFDPPDRKLRQARKIMEAIKPAADGTPQSISVGMVTRFLANDARQRRELRERNNPILLRYPHMRLPWRIAHSGAHLARTGSRWLLDLTLKLFDGTSNQYVIWREMFKKSDADLGPLMFEALLSSELSGLIYWHLGQAHTMISRFEVRGHIFKLMRSSNACDAPFWALVMDQTARRLYLVFRGTSNTIDSLINANATLRNIKLNELEVRVHGGCHELLQQQSEILKGIIYAHYQSEGDIGLTITGHSLGGAYAKLMYLELLGDGVIKPALLKCFTFGSPAVVGSDAASFTGWSGVMRDFEHHVHSFVNRFDIVPRLLGNTAAVSVFETIASMRGDLGVMQRYSELSGTDFIFNMKHYQPYGEYYILYHEPSHADIRVLKGDTLPEKRVLLSLPITKAFKPTCIFSDHLIIKYVDLLEKCQGRQSKDTTI